MLAEHSLLLASEICSVLSLSLTASALVLAMANFFVMKMKLARGEAIDPRRLWGRIK